VKGSTSNPTTSRTQPKKFNPSDHQYEEINRATTLEELFENWNTAVKNNRLDDFFQKEHQVIYVNR
jgi:hypothetical protein